MVQYNNLTILFSAYKSHSNQTLLAHQNRGSQSENISLNQDRTQVDKIIRVACTHVII